MDVCPNSAWMGTLLPDAASLGGHAEGEELALPRAGCYKGGWVVLGFSSAQVPLSHHVLVQHEAQMQLSDLGFRLHSLEQHTPLSFVDFQTPGFLLL